MECAQPTPYLHAKPKFCSHCQNPFEAVASAPRPVSRPAPRPAPVMTQEEPEQEVKAKTTSLPSWMNKNRPVKKLAPKRRMTVEDDGDDEGEEEVVEVPQLEGLDIKIEGTQRSRETIRDVMGTMSPDEAKSLRRPKEKVSRTAVMKEFRKEAGTLRNE